ncbi:MAG TPA: hypothetical protein VJ843_03515 [Candidatus Saccharimonadales bacterium]|nr:hypothetical protein [Candidatus Saccharimonadales bacterium]
MDPYKLLVGLLVVIILGTLLLMIIKKAGKTVVLCAIGLALILGPMACTALTKQ